MLVKNEVSRVGRALDGVVDVVDRTLIVDTGSTDGTPRYLKRVYGIDVWTGSLSPFRCFTLADLRNDLFREAGTDWVLTLDADERLDGTSIDLLKNLPKRTDAAGFFGRWRNHGADDTPFDDYKLFAFRSSYRHRGLVHDNAQVDLRDQGAFAVWLDGLTVRHELDPARLPIKRSFYRKRLECAVKREPDWIRYRWFLGYSAFLDGDWVAAEHQLSLAARAWSFRFPVESLNSAMVLAEIYASQFRAPDAIKILVGARRFWLQVKDDFEVRVNPQIDAWLIQARTAAEHGELDRIEAGRFAC